MNDTLPEIETLYREKLMARSGQERFRMGLEMFEVARVMMLAGLEDELRRILRRIVAARG